MNLFSSPPGRSKTPRTECGWPPRTLRGPRPALAVAGLALSSLPLAVPAARISEPETVLYGRIADRVGDREFLVTQGQLTWNLRTTGPGAREYQLKATLEPLGGGRYSYRLAIPHQVLAYDLAVNAKSVALSSAGGRLEHLGVTLDDRSLTVNPAAVEALALDATRRASAVRVDLTFASSGTDSDGDGAPDWWEDQQGLDKFDPTDAPKSPAEPGLTGTSNVEASASATAARTFGEWRHAWFPADSQSLDQFGQQDPDGDGVSNLLEYAFGLNPTATDADAARALPHAPAANGRGGIAFRRRTNATDLGYQVETSTDLFQWEDGAPRLAESTGESADTTTLVETADSAPTSHRFYRIRVARH